MSSPLHSIFTGGSGTYTVYIAPSTRSCPAQVKIARTMSGLVGYGSSDEDDDELQPEKPAKEPPTAPYAPVKEAPTQPDEPPLGPAPGPAAPPPPAAAAAVQDDSHPAVVPSDPAVTSPDDPTASPPASPYTTTRHHLRTLTMPTVPNFTIPDSPPPPPRNSEEAAILASRTKKFERFLALKQKGIHFHHRLLHSSSLRNPSFLPNLMQFAGLGPEDVYASALSEEAGVCR
ncbi:hypothetical protein BTJ68_13494 [Hortaea werneckii EXF-2000]|uniref:Uncharacterized protein n=1 Tax=Hortaea werneckii EXF-2000 TaxID=1157616 RepID=A0A1Z5STI1_HORWE|nr:hypothetical protein BTJ68_13494 [Hortaea werneckii EXF-2000]